MIEGQFFPSGIQPVQFEGGRPYNRWLRKDLREIIDGLGLSTGLKLALDAGDSSSYTSGQSWLDLSGNGYDFFRGAGSGAAADDPTFNGSAGGLSSSEYWSGDGGDFFTYDAANETWMQNLHKDSAKFTFCAWAYPAGSALNPLLNTAALNASNIGIMMGAFTNFSVSGLYVMDGSGSYAYFVDGPAIAASAWQLISFSVDEAAGTGSAQVNGTVNAITPTYTTPSAASASRTTRLFDACPSGARIGGVMAWEGVALTAAQLKSVFTATRGRYGV